jgi:hypothetical protein
MFELYSVYVVNTAIGCENYVEQQVSLSACTNVIIRITSNTNAIGPFDIYKDSLSTEPIFTGLTRQQMLDGIVVQLGPCDTYEMYIVTQDWIPLITQDNKLWDVRGFVYPFGVSSGTTSASVCLNNTSSSVIYAVGGWENADRFYVDDQLTTPFDGNNIWWRSLDFGFESNLVIQIDSDGFPINTNNC